MSDDNNDQETYREDLTPGARDARFQEPDSDFDYEAAAEEWDNELSEAEAQIDAINSEAVATASSEAGKAEGKLMPLLAGEDPKRVLFSEPESDEEVDTLVRALAEGNEFAVVRVTVDEPDIYRQRWDRQLTPIERAILSDLSYSFVRAEELVDPRIIAEVGRGHTDDKQ